MATVVKAVPQPQPILPRMAPREELNPFRIAQIQFDMAAEYLKLDPGLRRMAEEGAEIALKDYLTATLARGRYGYTVMSSRGGRRSIRHSTRCFTASKPITSSATSSPAAPTPASSPRYWKSPTVTSRPTSRATRTQPRPRRNALILPQPFAPSRSEGSYRGGALNYPQTRRLG